MKERKLGLAKRLSAMALALVMVFSLFSLSDLKALAAGDTAPTLAEDWTYDGKDHDLIVAPGQAIDPAYTLLYAVTETDREPNAPTSSNLGEWTINWRADDYFLVANAGEYYVWWCAYDADEDEFSTEPECAGLVEVEKATPLGYAPTGATVEWTGQQGGQNLVENVGGIPFDVANSQYLYAITDADEDDPTNYSWKTFAQGGTLESEVGEYKVWYRLDYTGNDTKNYEDGEISYVEAEITPKALVVTNAEQDKDYVNSTTAPEFVDLKFTKSDGTPLAGVDVTYATSKKDLTKTGANIYKTINAAFDAVAKNDTATAKSYKADTYKVYYSASLEGYETVTGVAELTVNKVQEITGTAPTVVNNRALVAATESQVQLITAGGTIPAVAKKHATDSTYYYQVNSSGKIPSTNSLSGWTTDWASLKKGEGKWYVFYMVASKDNPSVAASDVEYKTVTIAKAGTTITDHTYTKPTGITTPYTAEAQKIINKVTDAETGAVIQYYVGENDDTMPAANANGWVTLGSTEDLKRVKAGKYTVWTRVLEMKDSAGTVYAETTPVKTDINDPAEIQSKGAEVATPTAPNDYTEPAVESAKLEYSGRGQYLFKEGTGNNGLYWYYLVTKYNASTKKDDLVYVGTTAPKMTDVGIYKVGAVLLDSSCVIIDDTEYVSNYVLMRHPKDTKNLAVVAGTLWGLGADFMPNGTHTVEITKYSAEVTDPELVDDDLEYTGDEQSLIAKAGKTDRGNLYYLVEDDNGKIVSINGTAVNASDYTVYTMVTEMSTFEMAMIVAQANLSGPYFKTLPAQLNPYNINTPMDYVEKMVGAKSNIFDTPASQGSVTIEQAEPTVVGVKPITTEYTGYAQDLATEGLTDGGRIYYMAYDESGDEVWDEWTRIVPQAEDIGEYTIAYKVEIPEWDTDSNFTALDEVTLDEKAQIAAGLAEVTVAPEGLGYNADGTAKPLVTAGEAEDGVMVYALGSELMPVSDWSLEIPTATEEGTYHVWYKAQATEAEYGDSEAHVTVATIGQETVLYRIFNPATGEHIYTYDEAEKDNAIQNLGWTLDGTVSGTSKGTIPVYRLENLVNPGVHIYSKDENEVETLVSGGFAKLEGVQFITVPQGEGTDDYYRLSDPTGRFPHMYSNDQNEIASLVASGVYTLDGYAWSFPGTSN